MNVRGPRHSHRGYRVHTHGLLGLGTLAAGALCYRLLGMDKPEAILVPAFFLSTFSFGIFMYTKAQARRRWQAAWESYSDQDLSRKSFKSVEQEGTFSLVGTN